MSLVFQVWKEKSQALIWCLYSFGCGRNFTITLHNQLVHKVKVKSLSRVRLFSTLWTVAYQTPLSMGFSRQEYWSRLPFPFPGDPHWSGLPFPSPGDLPDSGIEHRVSRIEADAWTSEPPGKPVTFIVCYIEIRFCFYFLAFMGHVFVTSKWSFQMFGIKGVNKNQSCDL